MEYSKHYWTEFFGTYLLLLFAAGSAIMSVEYDEVLPSYIGALASGLAVWGLIQWFGRVTDCHINPAVTLGFLATGSLPRNRALMYVVLQLLGSFLAGITLYILFPESTDLGNTWPQVPPVTALFYEFFLSMVLMLVILVAMTMRNLQRWAPFLIGLTVCLEILWAGPITGGAMNPARSFGPAIVSGKTAFLWLYFFGPVTGMLFAVWIFSFLKNRSV